MNIVAARSNHNGGAMRLHVGGGLTQSLSLTADADMRRSNGITSQSTRFSVRYEW